jgi:hypothetical protein
VRDDGRKRRPPTQAGASDVEEVVLNEEEQPEVRRHTGDVA